MNELTAETDALADYLLESERGVMDLTHEPCGERLLSTMRVHMDTLGRLASQHECGVACTCEYRMDEVARQPSGSPYVYAYPSSIDPGCLMHGDRTHAGHGAEGDAPPVTVADALAAWEASGPTSLTVALLADALYGVRSVCDQVEANPVGWGGAAVVSLARTLRTRVPSAGDDGGPVCPGNERRTT